MGYTKRQFVTAALEEIGIAEYVFDSQPEGLQSAVRRLDSVLAEWNGRGVRLGYPLVGDPDASDLDTQTYVPDWANEAVVLNLAIRLAPSYGKTVSPYTIIAASRAFDVVQARFSRPVPYPTALMPVGSGNSVSHGYEAWTQPDPQTIDAGPDGTLEM